MDGGGTETVANPLGELASRLSELRCACGPTPKSFRAIAQETRFSHSAVHRAVNGVELPSWPLTRAFVHACDGDEVEIRQLWEAAESALRRARQRAHAESSSNLRREPATLIEFGARLKAAIDRADISQRQVAQKLSTSATTVNAIVTGRRLPSGQEVQAICEAAGLAATDVARWRSWRDLLAPAVVEADQEAVPSSPPSKRPRVQDRLRLRLRRLRRPVSLAAALGVALTLVSSGRQPAESHHDHDPPATGPTAAAGTSDRTSVGVSADAWTMPEHAPYPADSTADPSTSPEPSAPPSPSSGAPPNSRPSAARIPPPSTPAGVQRAASKPPQAFAATVSRQTQGLPYATDPAAPSSASALDLPSGHPIFVTCEKDGRFLISPMFVWVKSTDVTLAAADPTVPACREVKWPTEVGRIRHRGSKPASTPSEAPAPKPSTTPVRDRGAGVNHVRDGCDATCPGTHKGPRPQPHRWKPVPTARPSHETETDPAVRRTVTYHPVSDQLPPKLA